MRSRRLLLGASLAFALVAAACGDDGGSAAGTTGSPDPTSEHQSSLDAGDREIDPDGTFRFASAGAIDSLDPLHFDAVFGEWIPAYDTLLRRSDDEAGVLEGNLAESWTYSDDGLALALKIREGVTFHDGTELTPEVVKANLDRVLADPVMVAQGNLGTLVSVDVVDDHNVRITSSEPNLALHTLLGGRGGLGAMVSAKALQEGLDLSATEAGSGPYELVSFEPGVKVVYERFDGYWGGPDAASTKRLELHYLPDPQTQLNALRTGQVDGAILPPALVDAADKDDLQIVTASSDTVFAWVPNRTRSALDDERVRQAISYAIDRDAICESVWFSFCSPTSQPFEETSLAFVPELGADHYGYDPEKAKELLAEAGLDDGFTFGLTYLTIDPAPKLAEVVQAELAEVGITLELEAVEPAQLADVYLERDSIFGGMPSGGDPGLTLQGFYPATAGGNVSQQSPPELEELLVQIKAETDTDARAELIQAAARIIIEQALDWPIVFPQMIFVFGEGVAAFNSVASTPFDPKLSGVAMAAG